MDHREIAEHIFISGVRGVLPGQVINDKVNLDGALLKIENQSYDLDKFRNIFVIGAGKASASLGHYLERKLGNRITGGYIVTKYGFYCKLKRIMVTEAGHPIPDENSFAATTEILKITDSATEDDLVICIWTGGGSSLLADFPDPSTRQEIMFFNDMLVRCGANIGEINIVRKHLSKVKGGQLARHIWPASCITLYMSDVIGDHPDVVASGPTVPDNSTFQEALNVIEKYGLSSDMPASLLMFINEGVQGLHPDTPKAGSLEFSKSWLHIAGNNMTALKAAAREAGEMGLSVVIVTSDLAGDTTQASSFICETINRYRNDSSVSRPLCLLFGGETTVKVTGDGIGGRNQHLALYTALAIRDIPDITFLSAGTDGNDGNSDAAGAVVDSETAHVALSMNADPSLFIQNFDSYSFFRSVGGHVYTGPTMTNVMDIAIAIIN